MSIYLIYCDEDQDQPYKIITKERMIGDTETVKKYDVVSYFYNKKKYTGKLMSKSDDVKELKEMKEKLMLEAENTSNISKKDNPASEASKRKRIPKKTFPLLDESPVPKKHKNNKEADEEKENSSNNSLEQNDSSDNNLSTSTNDASPSSATETMKKTINKNKSSSSLSKISKKSAQKLSSQIELTDSSDSDEVSDVTKIINKNKNTTKNSSTSSGTLPKKNQKASLQKNQNSSSDSDGLSDSTETINRTKNKNEHSSTSSGTLQKKNQKASLQKNQISSSDSDGLSDSTEIINRTKNRNENSSTSSGTLQKKKQKPSFNEKQNNSSDDNELDQLYGKNYEGGKMVLIGDDIYCKASNYRDAMDANQATAVARNLLLGVYKKDILLKGTLSGQAVRTLGVKRRQEKMIALDSSAREAIIKFALDRAKTRNWEKKPHNTDRDKIRDAMRHRITELKGVHRKNEDLKKALQQSKDKNTEKNGRERGVENDNNDIGDDENVR